MANQSDWREVRINIDSSVESGQSVIRVTHNRQVQTSVTTINNTRPVHIRVDLNGQVSVRSQGDTARDPARLNLDMGGSVREIDQLDTEDHLNEGIRQTQDVARPDLDMGGPADETHQHQHDTEDRSDEEVRSTLMSLWARVRGHLAHVDPAALEEDSQNCPVCLESFPGFAHRHDVPVRLRCNHVIGLACVEEWISHRNNTCPVCRGAIFAHEALAVLKARARAGGVSEELLSVRSEIVELSARSSLGLCGPRTEESRATLMRKLEENKTWHAVFRVLMIVSRGGWGEVHPLD